MILLHRKGEKEWNLAARGGSLGEEGRHRNRWLCPGSGATSYCVIIPVGPSDADVARVHDLLDSLWTYEPETPLVLLIDDGGRDRGLGDVFVVPATCQLVTILNTRNGRGVGETSGLAAGMLLALSWVHRNAPDAWVLKLDTDALVIGPFCLKIAGAFGADPSIGMVGLYDRHCDGTPRDQSDFRRMLRKLLAPVAIWRKPQTRTGYLTLHLWGRGDTIRRQIREAISAGYRSADFILGGAYGLGSHAICRMAERGYFADPFLWLHTYVSEDVVLSMYTCAVGLRLHGMTGDNEPFAVQHYGIPDTPERLVARGYSIVHSVKSDARFPESEIRRVFADQRGGPTKWPVLL